MGCLGCVSVATIIVASLPKNSPPPSKNDHKVGVRRISKSPPLTTPKQQQPSVAEIEKAIGAGLFRDRDPRNSGENPTLFDKILSNTIGRPEGPVEKKLRETGEWILNSTEGASRSVGEQILVVVCLWILPAWLLCFFVASGIIKLPFSAPFLDDLIM